MNKPGKRKNISSFNVSDVPLISVNRPLLHNEALFERCRAKLESLLDQGEFEQAKLFFHELVKSNKFNFRSLWQTGIEVIGRSSSRTLTAYLKALFISAPPSLSAEIFAVYIDQLLIEERWTEAMEEMELRYDRPMYHHPITLRKMALCSYYLWKTTYEKLPESYFEDEIHSKFNTDIVRYEKYLRTATKYLMEAHKAYVRDSEILDMYFTFLNKTDNQHEQRIIILESLAAYNQNPEYFLLFTLMKHNNDNQYFENEDYIIQLYEFDPRLSKDVRNLEQYCKNVIHRLETMDDTHSDYSDSEEKGDIGVIEKENLIRMAVRIFRLFVNRLEILNIELWFCQIATEICQLALNQEILDVYFYYNVDKLLRSDMMENHQDVNQIREQADKMGVLVSKYVMEFGRLSADVSADVEETIASKSKTEEDLIYLKEEEDTPDLEVLQNDEEEVDDSENEEDEKDEEEEEYSEEESEDEKEKDSSSFHHETESFY